MRKPDTTDTDMCTPAFVLLFPNLYSCDGLCSFSRTYCLSPPDSCHGAKTPGRGAWDEKTSAYLVK